MKTKAVPAIVMLSAGFIFCIFSISKGQDFLTFAKSLIVVMLIFYVLGGIGAFIIQKNIVESKKETDENPSEETEGENKNGENGEKETQTGKEK
ncbi:MAG: hypothetical protein MR355_09780 [Lachnospiraceae bacterium]|nr:hypothetical protein [Lachnospiraceae bacterium]